MSKTATDAEVDTAFRRLSHRAHPDTGGTAGLFRLLVEARDAMKQGAGRRADDRPPSHDPTPPPAPPEEEVEEEWEVADDEQSWWDNPPSRPPPAPPPYPPPPYPPPSYPPPSDPPPPYYPASPYPPQYYPPPPYWTPAGQYPPPPPPYAAYGAKRKRYRVPRGDRRFVALVARVPAPHRVRGWLVVITAWFVAAAVVGQSGPPQHINVARASLQFGMQLLFVLLIAAACSRRYVRRHPRQVW